MRMRCNRHVVFYIGDNRSDNTGDNTVNSRTNPTLQYYTIDTKKPSINGSLRYIAVHINKLHYSELIKLKMVGMHTHITYTISYLII